VLRVPDVVARIPVGLQPEDSAAMFDAIVLNWTRTQLLRNAVDGEDAAMMDKIDRMVDDYRHKLLLLQYIRNLESKGDGEVPESAVKEYYDTHRDEFRLERDLVKGLFMKIDASSAQKDRLKRWMSRADDVSVGKIEKYGMNDAIAYEYFLDRWVDISSLPEMTPLRMSGALDNPEAGGDYEAQSGGVCYLLHVAEKIPAGEIMPYDFAAPQIRENIRSGQRRDSEEALMRTLAQRSKDSGVLRAGSYDIDKLLQKNNKK